MTDLVKTAGSIAAKGAFKRLVALKGIPGEVVDIVAATVSKALNSNDIAAKEEFERIKEEMLFDLVAQQDKYRDKRPPSAEDVHAGLERFAQNYHGARNHRKRKVLFNAFYNAFQPGFYDEGIAEILWAKVENLEYPDFIYLHKLIHNLYLGIVDPLMPSPYVGEAVHASANDKKAQLQCQSQDAEFATRLARENLLLIEDQGHGISWVYPKGLAKEMRSFALREAWRAESADSALDRQADPERGK